VALNHWTLDLLWVGCCFRVNISLVFRLVWWPSDSCQKSLLTCFWVWVTKT
jgi:hypothetical protein